MIYLKYSQNFRIMLILVENYEILKLDRKSEHIYKELI